MEEYGQFVDIEKVNIHDIHCDNIYDKKDENCINEFTLFKIVSNSIISLIGSFFRS